MGRGEGKPRYAVFKVLQESEKGRVKLNPPVRETREAREKEKRSKRKLDEQD